MSRHSIVTSFISAALIGCSANAYNVSLEPEIQQDGAIIYRYGDVIAPGRGDTSFDEKDRLGNLDEWMKKAKKCPSGYQIIKKDVISTNTIVDSYRVFYFIKCK